MMIIKNTLDTTIKLNLDGMIDDKKRLGPVRLIWQGNNDGEKFTQVTKHEFIS